jgi:glucose-1-phosphate cytidylyltransferase
MLTYGDGVANINIQELLKFHKSHGKIDIVTGVNPYLRFGEFNIRDEVVATKDN